MRRPSIQVGDQPPQALSCTARMPSARRRGTASISAIVMSAVSSVRTPGVFVTVMPRATAVSTSMLSTPLPKLAMRRRFAPAWDSTAVSMRSVMVGTSTSAWRTASTSSAWLSGRSVSLSFASKSSRMRVSTTSGSFRVTTTCGFFLAMLRVPRGSGRMPGSAPVNPEAACSAASPVRFGLLYQSDAEKQRAGAERAVGGR